MNHALTSRQQVLLEFQASLGSMSVAEKKQLAKDLTIATGDSVMRLALVLQSLEADGEKVTLRYRLREWLNAVLVGSLLPESVAACFGNDTALTAMTYMPLEIQAELIEQRWVAVRVAEDKVEEIPLDRLRKEMVLRVFDTVRRRIVPPEEQRAPTPKAAKKPTDAFPCEMKIRLTEAEWQWVMANADRKRVSASDLAREDLRKMGWWK